MSSNRQIEIDRSLAPKTIMLGDDISRYLTTAQTELDGIALVVQDLQQKIIDAEQYVMLARASFSELLQLLSKPVERPPEFKQCDMPWGPQPYSDLAENSFCFSGCLVCCFAALAHWHNGDGDPLTVASQLNMNGAFAGPYLGKPALAGHKFTWHGRDDRHYYSPRYDIHETSLVDYTQRAADVQMLDDILNHHPIPVQVDYYPGGRIEPHFVLMVEYYPDPDGGLLDDALVMDPISGYSSILQYFNPAWWDESDGWMRRSRTSRVARTVLGARIWQPIMGGM